MTISRIFAALFLAVPLVFAWYAIEDDWLLRWVFLVGLGAAMLGLLG